MSAFYFDPFATGTAVFLGPTEARLMELAWEKNSLTVKQALFFLGPKNDLAYTTVMTVLTRLTEKGLLKRVKDGRVFVYEPTSSKSKFIKERTQVVKDCLSKNFKKS